jgi:Rps23 Pro-64 3,4-dihydroxylase Tpa1-like proline 4-hydroxylase
MNESIFNNIEFFKNVYSKEKIFTIPDFLNTELANEIYDNINSIPKENWSVSMHPYNPRYYTFPNTEQNSLHIKEGKKSATNSYNNGHFSYVFYRYDNQHDINNCSCTICKGIFNITNQKTKEFINNITDENVETPISIFISTYEAGCFLGTHTDTGRGKLAFVLNLTKEWNEEDGGNFELLDWNYSTVLKKVKPMFNTLTIFRVTGDGIPHRVSRVKDDVKNKRIAISGWFI